MSTEPVNKFTTFDQLSTPLQRGAQPVRISQTQLRKNNAEWEHLLLGGVLVGVLLFCAGILSV
jgi:hypothetical protein